MTTSKHRLLLTLVTLALSFSLLLPSVVAQQATGKILGTVTDPSGALLPGVNVTVTSTATGVAYNAISDKDGAYVVLNLPIGAYTVTAERSGFRKLLVRVPALEINQNLKVDLTLQVGGTSEVVEVTTGGAAVETENATIGDSVTSRPIIEMPLNGRNVLELAKLEPGVTDENPGHDGAGSFSIAGSRLDSVTYLLDGGLNNNLLDNSVVYNPNPDTVAEFRILQNNYNAEYGRNAGGIISVVTKSGTNSWHGSAFDFLRNDALNANSFFNKRPAPGDPIVPRDVLKRNQFGGTIGGPIKRDKAFFFFSYQGQRQTQQQGHKITGFTDSELAGDFSQSAGASTLATFLAANPYFQPNAALAAQGIIDPSRIDPVAQKYIAAGIIPHSPSGQLTARGSAKDDRNEYTAKLDYNLTAKDKISASLGMARATQLCPFAQNSCDPTALDTANAFPVTRSDHNYFLNVAYTRVFSPALLNEFRVTAQRQNSLRYKPAVKLPTSADLGVGNTPDQLTGPPLIYFYDSGDWLGFSYRGPTDLVNNTFAFSDTLSWVKGKHTMKYGVMYSPYQNNTVYDFYVNGEFDFYGSQTYSGSSVEFADFLMGLPDEYYQWPSAPSNIRSHYYAAFAQDEWRVTRNLVLTLGLRYEYSSPKRDTLGRSFSLNPGQQSTRFVNAPLGLVFPGDKGVPKGSNFPDRNDFGPRFGFAWDPSGNGKTSVRGGIGVFYDILKGEDNLQFNGQPPFFGYTDVYFDVPTGTSAPNYFGDPYGTSFCNFCAAGQTYGNANPFPSKPPASNIDFGNSGFLPFGGGGVYFVEPHIRTPYIYQYNLSVQHELTNSMRVDLAYVGSAAHKLTDLVDRNPFILGTSNRVLNTQPGVTGDPWNYVATFANVGHSNYNSLQLALKKDVSDHRYFGSSYFTVAYTYSKSLDNASGFRQGSASVPAYNPNQFYALSDIDIPHRLTISGGWDLPFADFVPGAPKKLTRGWSVYPIITWRKGFPLDVFASLKHRASIPGPSGAGDSQLVRANLVGNSVTIYDPKSQTDPSTMGAIYFNAANFETASLDALNGSTVVPTAAQRTYGTLPRHFFRGPNRSNMDFSFAKVTPLVGERTKLEIRADFFNIFNTAQFRDPSTNPNSSYFGEITTTYDPRIIQLGARITF